MAVEEAFLATSRTRVREDADKEVEQVATALKRHNVKLRSNDEHENQLQAVRRDFIIQSASITAEELLDVLGAQITFYKR